jgi:hypothetical protein
MGSVPVNFLKGQFCIVREMYSVMHNHKESDFSALSESSRHSFEGRFLEKSPDGGARL